MLSFLQPSVADSILTKLFEFQSHKQEDEKALREYGEKISTEDGEKPQPSRMSIQPLKESFIRWLESMSQTPLNAIENRR